MRQDFPDVAEGMGICPVVCSLSAFTYKHIYAEMKICLFGTVETNSLVWYNIIVNIKKITFTMTDLFVVYYILFRKKLHTIKI